MINAWAIARDPRLWERAEEFSPDRFTNSSVDFKGQDFKFIPFGAGRRGCPGIGFAIPTIELALANLLHHFDWELPDEMQGESLDMSESAGLATHKKENLFLVAKPRVL
ncbi:cytochrome P450 71A1-like [Elaeis guineensis]|uniref:cytochrome P450 71A1-like n=1 Tax=Elaeis guineensis var. tenera TaxID=51953 RepID=UPI003C6CD206